MDNNGGGLIGEADIDVAAGGEWLAIEFDMGEAGGDDAGIIYWDYDPNAAGRPAIGRRCGLSRVRRRTRFLMRGRRRALYS